MEAKGKEGEGSPGVDRSGRGRGGEKLIIRDTKVYRDGETKSLSPGSDSLTHRAYLAL